MRKEKTSILCAHNQNIKKKYKKYKKKKNNKQIKIKVKKNIKK